MPRLSAFYGVVIYMYWRDPAFFARVVVEHSSVVWPNGVDLDPLVLHGDFEPAESQSGRQVV